MTNTIANIAAKALPALSGSTVIFDPMKNAYLTQQYVSAMGNCYHKELRISKRLVVCYFIGQGYIHTFLNGIILFCWDGKRAKIIAQKSWGGCVTWIKYNRHTAKELSIRMLRDYLAAQAKLLRQSVPERQILDFSREMIEEANQNLIA